MKVVSESPGARTEHQQALRFFIGKRARDTGQCLRILHITPAPVAVYVCLIGHEAQLSWQACLQCEVGFQIRWLSQAERCQQLTQRLVLIRTAFAESP